MQIRIYDYNLTPLTTLNLKDVEGLEYENQINGDGSCEFSCRVDNPKITPNSIEMNNRVKIFEGSECKFYGFILENSYDLNTIKVRCVSLSNIFKKRVNPTNSVSGNLNVVIPNILDSLNAYNNTGITAGDITLTSNINKSYNDDTMDYVLSDLIGNSQMYVDPQGKLNISEVIGKDRTQEITFRYDIRQIQASNLNNFIVKESGQPIYSEIIGRDNNSGRVVVQNPSYIAKYGVLQGVKSYSNGNGNSYLISESERDLSDRTYSPELSLSPKIEDTFDVGDIVRVKLYNKFVDIDTSYQILVKTVRYVGTQKTIKVKVNDKQKSILDLLAEQSKRLTQLEK